MKRTTVEKRRGTRANQIALICCASDKNVNARRPLVIQPQLRGLLFPSSLHSFPPTRPFCHPPSRPYSFSRARALHGCPYLRFYVRLCHVLATSIPMAREYGRMHRVLSFSRKASRVTGLFVLRIRSTLYLFGFAIRPGDMREN